MVLKKKLLTKANLFCVLELMLTGAIYAVALILSVRVHIYVGITSIIMGVPLLWLLCNNRYEEHGRERRKAFMVIWIVCSIIFLDVGGRHMIMHGHYIMSQGYYSISRIFVMWGEFLRYAQGIAVDYFGWLTTPYAIFDITWGFARYMPIQSGICLASVLGSRWYIELKYSEEMREE